MSGFEELSEVMDLVEEQQRRLRRLIGSQADAKAVRALLEEYQLRAWQRGSRTDVRPLTPGISPGGRPSQAVTPIESPRVAIDINVADQPVDIDAARRRRRRDRGEP
jgi:hypothetical protein